MVNRSLLTAKLVELQDRMQRVRSHTPAAPEQLALDRDALDIVSFNLMLCVQVCADIASHLIADERWTSARSLAEGFTRLQEQGVILPATAASLKQAVGLRNVAHGYAQIDVDACFRAATEGLAELNAFAKQVSQWAARA
jgi:uncharacterized protein YutE (UPF0331/DUF86 family)